MDQLSRDSEENFDRFIVEALATGCIWGLQGQDGWALVSSEKYDNTDVMPFWSQPEFAKVHQADDWADYDILPVALEEFLEDWLPGMHEDVFLVGVNLDEELDGREMEPLDLLSEIEAELK